jgi:hypothetical protein
LGRVERSITDVHAARPEVGPNRSEAGVAYDDDTAAEEPAAMKVTAAAEVTTANVTTTTTTTTKVAAAKCEGGRRERSDRDESKSQFTKHFYLRLLSSPFE